MLKKLLILLTCLFHGCMAVMAQGQVPKRNDTVQIETPNPASHGMYFYNNKYNVDSVARLLYVKDVVTGKTDLIITSKYLRKNYLAKTDTGTAALPSLYSMEHRNWTWYGDHTFHGAVTFTGPANVVLTGAALDMGNNVIENVQRIDINDALGNPAKGISLSNYNGGLQAGTATAGAYLDPTTNLWYTSGSGGRGPGLPYALLVDVADSTARIDTTFLKKTYPNYIFRVEHKSDTLPGSSDNYVSGHPGNRIEGGRINNIFGGGRNVVITPPDTTYNEILGVHSFRTILGSYDQRIGSYETTATSLIASPHARADSVNHGQVSGGSYDTLRTGSYSGIYTATQSRLSGNWSGIFGGQSNRVMVSDYSVNVSGSLNLQWNNTYGLTSNSINARVKNSTYVTVLGSSNTNIDNVTASIQAASVNAKQRNGQHGVMLGCNGCLSKGGNYLTQIANLNGTIDSLSTGSTMIGVQNGSLSGLSSTSIGGETKQVYGRDAASIGGGSIVFLNTTLTDYSFHAGGLNDTVGGARTTRFSNMLASRDSHLSGEYSTIGYGRNVISTGDYSFTGGKQAKSTASGTFTIADSQTLDLINTTANSFKARFSAGYDLAGAGGVKAATLILTAVANGTAGTDSLIVKSATTNISRKISPTYYAPLNGGALTGATINRVTITTPATAATLTILNGKTLTANNSITLAGTDGTTMTFPSGSGSVVTGGSITWPGTIYTTPTTGSVNSAGVLSFSPALATQTANTIFAGPSTGSAATPTFRTLVAADMPAAVVQATGTPTSGSIVSYLSGTPAWNTFTGLTSGDFVYWNGSNYANRTIIANGLLSWNASTATMSTINPSHTIFTPTTGGTVTLVNNQYNIINPAGALVALTVTLPSSPANNDKVEIKFTQSVTTVTYAGGTVADGVVSPAAGGLVTLVYDSTSTTWY